MEAAHSTTQTEFTAIGLLKVVPILENEYFKSLESGGMVNTSEI